MTEDKKAADVVAAEVQEKSAGAEGIDAAGIQEVRELVKGPAAAAGIQEVRESIKGPVAVAGIQEVSELVKGPAAVAAGIQEVRELVTGPVAAAGIQNGAAAPRIKHYNKLVRDKIPEIIAASGKTCVTEVLPDDAYLQMLDAKLDEELAEYHADQNIEELADLLEVIYAAAAARGCSREQLEQIRAEKADNRGGFEKRLLLKEVRG